MFTEYLLNLVSLAALMWIASTIFSAWVSDIIGRKKTYIIGFLIQMVWIWVVFNLLDTENYGLIGLGMVVLAIPIGFTYGPQSAMFAEMFPAKIRYSGAGLAYAFGSILGGAFAPFIATALQAKFNTSTAVAAYIFGVTVIAFITLLTLKDRTGRDLSPAADGELNEVLTDLSRGDGVLESTFDRGAGF